MEEESDSIDVDASADIAEYFGDQAQGCVRKLRGLVDLFRDSTQSLKYTEDGNNRYLIEEERRECKKLQEKIQVVAELFLAARLGFLLFGEVAHDERDPSAAQKLVLEQLAKEKQYMNAQCRDILKSLEEHCKVIFGNTDDITCIANRGLWRLEHNVRTFSDIPD